MFISLFWISGLRCDSVRAMILLDDVHARSDTYGTLVWFVLGYSPWIFPVMSPIVGILPPGSLWLGVPGILAPSEGLLLLLVVLVGTPSVVVGLGLLALWIVFLSVMLGSVGWLVAHLAGFEFVEVLLKND